MGHCSHLGNISTGFDTSGSNLGAISQLCFGLLHICCRKSHQAPQNNTNSFVAGLNAVSTQQTYVHFMQLIGGKLKNLSSRSTALPGCKSILWTRRGRGARPAATVLTANQPQPNPQHRDDEKLAAAVSNNRIPPCPDPWTL
jgi:hypothetical protein